MTTADEYTPTTGQVRFAFIDRKNFEAQVGGVERPTDEESGDAFDRWLEAHDAQVAAKALRDAAAGLRAGARGSKCNPGCHEADQITLRLRADRLEEQGVEG